MYAKNGNIPPRQCRFIDKPCKVTIDSQFVTVSYDDAG